jgi:hypothetical protein
VAVGSSCWWFLVLGCWLLKAVFAAPVACRRRGWCGFDKKTLVLTIAMAKRHCLVAMEGVVGLF